MRLLAAIVSIMLLAAASTQPAEDGWPREIEAGGFVVTIYQPQVDSFDGDTIESRAAVSVKPADGSGEPLFGAVWISARVETDRDARLVQVRDVEVPQARFPDADEAGAERLARLLEAEIPRWDISMALDRLIADLDEGTSVYDTPGLKHEPPVIVHSTEPAVLLQYDGDPVVRPMPEQPSLEHAINTPFAVMREKDTGTFYLSGGGDLWYAASDPLGPWEVTTGVPATIAAFATDAEEADDTEAPPRIVVATGPTELIVFDGRPRWTPIEDGALLYCDNTDADVFLEVSTQSYYLLLSGRWFRGTAVDDRLEWTHVPNDGLPESFSDIPEDSVNGHVLVAVAGTAAAREAALDNAIPQTAAIRRDDRSFTVRYDGEPAFEPVEDVPDVLYAVNTESSVFRVGTTYYACDEAVWYRSAAATGPWVVATEIPVELYEIPPSNPLHNVTYVKVYDTTPEVVYVGYTPGYVGSYWYHGCVVWGTGWYYRPWYGPYYYPRPWTWGLNVRYHPYYGWSFGLTWSNGPFSITIGRGGYGGWYGAGGYRPVYRPYPRPGYRKPVARPQTGTRPATRPAQGRGNIYDRPASADRRAQRPATTDRRRPATVQQPNDVLTDRSGNVYRKDRSGGWEQRQGGQWKPAEGLDRARPAQPQADRPSGGAARPQLERDARARQRGNQRSGQYRSYGGGGRRPSGGGRRR